MELHSDFAIFIMKAAIFKAYRKAMVNNILFQDYNSFYTFRCFYNIFQEEFFIICKRPTVSAQSGRT